jgi:hypothetical protein
MTLEEIKTWAAEIEGQWNGDLPGKAEDRAVIAEEIICNCDHIKKLMEEIEVLDGTDI